MSEYYYYGMTAVMLLTTCWTFAAVRWFHMKSYLVGIWFSHPSRRIQMCTFGNRNTDITSGT